MAFVKWLSAVIILCFATFGIIGCLRFFMILSMMLLGCFLTINLAVERKKRYPTQIELLNDKYVQHVPADQLLLSNSRKLCKIEEYQRRNKRITSYNEVDMFILEIIEYLIDDYVTTWYTMISDDLDFVYALKLTALDAAINVSNRLQSVDWLSHITGKTVDELACHLRLFRGAGGGVATSNFKQQRRRSPARSPARNVAHHRRNKSDTDVATFTEMQSYPSTAKAFVGTKVQSGTLEDRFFDLEHEAERKAVCRKSICVDPAKKHAFVREVIQLVIFLVFNNDELRNNVTLSILRALLCNVTTSLLDYIVNPDTLNTLLLRLCSKDTLSTDSFLAVLRTTDNIDELKSTLAIVQNEIHNLSSKDTVGECDINVKQQLSSLQYLTRLLTNRTSLLTPAATIRSTMFVTKLPLGFLLDNHLALCYFLDFAHSMSAHPYIFCHISIEAWQAAALKHLNEIAKSPIAMQADQTPSGVALRAAASNIYDQYFSKKSLNYLDVPIGILEKFHSKMNMPLNDKCLTWFDDIKKFVHSKLQAVETAFRNSSQYERLLAELDLEGISPGFENPRNIDHRRTGSSGATFYVPRTNVDITSDDNSSSSLSGSSKEYKDDDSNEYKEDMTGSSSSLEVAKASYLAQDLPCRLEVVIVETGLMQERGRAFGVYALEVKRWDPTTGKQYCWHVYRRYSDFHELQTTIKEAYPELSKMEFPSKKTFHNTSRNVLERRMVTLSSWISALASLGSPGGPPRYAPLHLYLLPFLSPRGPQDKHQPTINSLLVQPLRQGMRTLRNVPEQLANTVDDIMGGLSKLINTNKSLAPNSMIYNQNPSCLYAGFDNENVLESEELPLRMMLFLLDEVFELRCRNRWLRRQVITILRQILTTMFADVLNRKIVDAISSFTSPASVASYLDHFKRVYFINNKKNRIDNERDLDAQARARVAAKTFLLSCRQDELKRLIGSQTTQKGLMTVFELFQNQTLNTRLIFVLVEGLIKVIFQEKEVYRAFQVMLNENPNIVN